VIPGLGGSSGAPTTETILPTVKVGGSALPDAKAALLVRAMVDNHLHLPDMFELTFVDTDGTLASSAGFSIGASVEVHAGASSSDTLTKLTAGEVTSIEAICEQRTIYTVIRGYDKAHRLQRANRTRTFVNKTDSDIAKEVAGDAGLSIGTIDSTSVVYDHLAQVSQTDWDFLNQRAREIGYETGVEDGKFFFRAASGSSAGGGGGLGGALGAAAGALGVGGGGPPTLSFLGNLLMFRPRISAANITPKVEIRVWDPNAATVAVGSADAKTGTATIDGQDPKQLASSFSGNFPALPSPPALPPIPGLPKIDFGIAPDSSAYVVVDRPLAVGSNAQSAADKAAQGLADHIASTFAEAEGVATGDPKIKAGSPVTVADVPAQFVGSWMVSHAVHLFDAEQEGYVTRFYVSGRQDRSLLALASGGGARNGRPGLEGLVCAVVTNTKDADTKGRVKVAMPWLAPNYESDWARVVQVGAGRRSGAAYIPEVGDEVLIGFEFGDPRRPYVLGGLVNDNTDYDLIKGAVNGSGAVVKRGFMSPAGNGLVFGDELPPGPPGAAPPTTSSMVLGTKDNNLALSIDQANGTVTLTCKPAPPSSKTPTGTLTIECGDAGTVNIITGNAGTMKISSGGQLEIEGKLGVKITSNAMLELKGTMIKLN
jgi:phage protein D